MNVIRVSDIPNLMKDWDYSRNVESPQEIPAKSVRRFYWTSADCGHSWTDYPKGKNLHNRGCRICSNEEILSGYNDFKTLYPSLASELKDFVETSDTLDPRSGVLLQWICKNKHSYNASVSDRIKGRSCYFCSGRKVFVGFNDFPTTHPHLFQEWDFSKNKNIDPYSLTLSSREAPHWTCHRGHEWQMRLDARINQKQNCPYCSGTRLIPGETDLATKFPKIAKDWHSTLNGDLKPTEVKPFTHKFVWWTCSRLGHKDYRQQISKRTGRGTGCPECSKGRGTSKGEFEVAEFLESLNMFYIQGSRSYLQGMELDFYLKHESKGIEYNGEWTHCNSALKPDSRDATFKDYHLRKLAQAEAKSVDLAFVWEHDWKEHRLEVESALIDWINTGNKSSLFNRIESYKDIDKNCCAVRV